MIVLEEIRKTKKLSSFIFESYYVEHSEPVVILDLMDNWPAKAKWNLNFLKNKYGYLQVPIYSPNSSKSGKKYMQPDQHISLREYIEMIQKGATDWRLFLYNIFDDAPELRQDYQVPKIMDGFLEEYPFTFFGGAGSKVPLHYDIDMSHVFLSQFEGKKRVVLFSPDQSKHLYHLPFSVASYIDIDNPDYEKYPALKKVTGYECILEPGETLFIPSGFWHYITYIDAGFSMSQRVNDSIFTKVEGAVNIATHFIVDKGMNQLFGEKWREIKENIAHWRAEEEE